MHSIKKSQEARRALLRADSINSFPPFEKIPLSLCIAGVMHTSLCEFAKRKIPIRRQTAIYHGRSSLRFLTEKVCINPLQICDFREHTRHREKTLARGWRLRRREKKRTWIFALGGREEAISAAFPLKKQERGETNLICL